MFEITKEQISQLNDTDLRILVGKLCEQTVLKCGLSPVGVTYGGNQDAPDGGVDVRVSISSFTSIDYIPKADTIFQVKKYNVAPAKLRDEICPNGILRDCIADIISKKGAYIIVSGEGVTDTGLDNRKKIMAECIAHADHGRTLILDYYDSQRIASWANMYPSIVVWIKNKIGAIDYNGWQSYGPWSNPSAQSSDEYILDAEIRIKDLYSNSEGLSVIDAINQIRTKLIKPNAIIRITGLSGVGKTRFVESLFDERLGENFLSPGICIYGDIAAELSPSPVAAAREFITIQKDAILIIDNCSPETHGALAKICSTVGSRLRLITVEYDVKDDIPEEVADVYCIEPASNKVIELLLERRYPDIEKSDAEIIAEFSGGNARVAFALASTLERGQSLAGLRNQELFERLLYQRNSRDAALLKEARTLALVYSFHGGYGDPNCELGIIAELIGISDLKMYEAMRELEERKLIQTRRPWKAVLPHAIANRLAKEAFQKIPAQQINALFGRPGNERLLKSLAHRMSFLHDCEEVVLLARSWVIEGVLSDFSCYENHQHYMLQYIAPIVPKSVLDLLLTVVQTDEGLKRLQHPHNSVDYALLIGQIGYESCYFDKAISILIPMVLQETSPTDNALHVLETYFQLYLSGTHATLAQRLSVIKCRAQRDCPAEQCGSHCSHR